VKRARIGAIFMGSSGAQDEKPREADMIRRSSCWRGAYARFLVSTVDLQKPGKRVARLQQIRDRVLIERGEESIRSLAQRTPQQAAFLGNSRPCPADSRAHRAPAPYRGRRRRH
jgi:hypothetical protein